MTTGSGNSWKKAARPARGRLRLAGVMPAAGLFVLATALRVWQIESLSLNHFDEGVLVSSAFGVWLHGPWHFPLAQPLQAPPLFVWLIAGAFDLTQTASPLIALYLCAALGSVTVPLYWALLLKWHGPSFAMIAAALMAASDLHIAFSRMALTDVPLTFWFVVSTYCLCRANESLTWSHAAHASPRLVRRAAAVAWCLATAFAAAAACLTKYNGWMWLAMAMTTWLIVAARDRLRKRRGGDLAGETSPGRFSRPIVLLAIGLAVLVSLACFAPWYAYVERTVEGGYHAVTTNHLRYFGGLASWPGRAARLWLSLTAFRHFGWIVTLLGLAIGLLWCRVRRDALANNGVSLSLVLPVGLALLSATFALGGDAVITVLSAAAIVPALIWGGWLEVFFAVWAGSFLIMTPFYHPYTRLLAPAVPAEIALSVWLMAQAFGPSGQASQARASVRDLKRQVNRWLLGLACCGLLLAALAWRPFGWIPSQEVWQRWSARHAYRALGDAILRAGLPADAVVLCQGPPAMTLYLDREWAPLEFLPFELWLPHVDANRDCYLAADFWGLYAENHQMARDSFSKRIGCLRPVAVVPNDLNLMTLLDYLPAAQVAEHLNSAWPVKHRIDPSGRPVTVPADLTEPFADVIVLYRIDRDCVERFP